MFNSFKNTLKELWISLFRSDGKETSRTKAVIIAISLVMAFLLWLVVNLNRNYTVDVKIPLALGQISANRALAEKLPKNVTVSLNGEGWSLLEVYRNPPKVYIEVSGEQVNLFEQVRRQLQATTNLRVQTVDPLYLVVQLQKKASKKVPIVPRIQIDFAKQYSFLEPPALQPDSVMVIGARSVINNITYWATDSLSLENIKEDLSVSIPLKEPKSLLALSEQNITFKARVAQYTEGEVTVPVELKSRQARRNVVFSPQKVKITYLAPIKEFPDLRKMKIFAAFVRYRQVKQDTTGFVSPHIKQLVKKVHVKVQQVRPKQVAYFNIVSGR